MQDPATISHLEVAAIKRPRLYRASLTALAIGGATVLTAVLVFPLAFVPLVGVLLINHPIFYAIGAVALGLLIWLMQPTMRLSGRELRRDEAPGLFEAVAGLASTLRVPGDTAIALDDSFNASAAEVGRFFGSRRILTLGVPLLAALDRTEVLAVIAHELGHFSRRHGRLGHWLYRARAGWLRYLRSMHETNSAFERAAVWYAERFVPYFSARSFVYSRCCEYEADSDAALAVGSQAVAAALSRFAALEGFWSDTFPREMGRLRLAALEPPADYHQRFEVAVRDLATKDARDRLDAALTAPSSTDDTHPRLADRLAALDEAPVLTPLAANAGEALLGGAWPRLRGEFDARWVHQVRGRWTFDHLRLKHAFSPTIGDESGPDSRPERRLARARALRVVDPAKGLVEIRELHAEMPTDKAIALAYAAALLNEDDATGVAMMEALSRDSLALRYPAYTRLLAFYQRKSDSRQVERWSVQAAMAARRRTAARADFWNKADVGQAHPSRVSQWVRGLLIDVVYHDPCVAHACLLEAETTLKGRTRSETVATHALALVLDPDNMGRLGLDEEALAERYEEFLTTVIPPTEIAAVRTFLRTEAIPDRYGRASPLALEQVAPQPSSDALATTAAQTASA